jgi:N utilization substance protein A
MKSEFMMAFNEICEERGLPKDVVIEALKTALISAYRRNTNVSNTQEVTAEIDQRTGEPTIYAEKEVVDSIMDTRTEVLIRVAHAAGHTEAVLGDTVMVESTPANFGRIAAQTAKQVILQRVREAEREMLYEDFSAREGEIVNGTVQSVSGQNITIGLGRTEAVLPKSQQVPTERYRAHDKIRVYVLEVRRTNRGPQIYVSRNHRNFLRRLLELEVPEIYNGQVEIKSIAREAGARSKVAVMALQPGIDPVGACVGMRGVRIQSIVRELNDEKIDVIEWDSDQKTFIAKALSPARVSQVFLEDHPDEGKTASVIVPDDQLSLAIGREGQNARLAAKLTGWRIDIKSLTEAATEAMGSLDHPSADPAIITNKELLGQADLVLAKKEANRPITSEDYMLLNRVVAGVEGKIVAQRAIEFERVMKERAAARRLVPEQSWEITLADLALPEDIQTQLEKEELFTAGDILYRFEIGEESLLSIKDFDEDKLALVKEAVASALEEVIEEAELEAPEITEEADAVEAEAVAEEVAEVEAVAEEAVEAEEEEAVEAEAEKEVEVTAEVEAVAEEEEAVEEEEEEEPDLIAAIDDLATPLIQVDKPKKKEKKKVVVVQPVQTKEETEDDDDADKRRYKGKQLVFDEERGRVVTKRKRKGSRSRPEWEDFEDMDVEDVLDEEFK